MVKSSLCDNSIGAPAQSEPTATVHFIWPGTGTTSLESQHDLEGESPRSQALTEAQAGGPESWSDMCRDEVAPAWESVLWSPGFSSLADVTDVHGSGDPVPPFECTTIDPSLLSLHQRSESPAPVLTQRESMLPQSYVQAHQDEQTDWLPATSTRGLSLAPFLAPTQTSVYRAQAIDTTNSDPDTSAAHFVAEGASLPVGTSYKRPRSEQNIPGTHCFVLTTARKRQCRPLSSEERHARKELQAIGACLLCRFSRSKCSASPACDSCQKICLKQSCSIMRYSLPPCIRTFDEISPLTMLHGAGFGWLAQYPNDSPPHWFSWITTGRSIKHATSDIIQLLDLPLLVTKPRGFEKLQKNPSLHQMVPLCLASLDTIMKGNDLRVCQPTARIFIATLDLLMALWLDMSLYLQSPYIQSDRPGLDTRSYDSNGEQERRKNTTKILEALEFNVQKILSLRQYFLSRISRDKNVEAFLEHSALAVLEGTANAGPQLNLYIEALRTMNTKNYSGTLLQSSGDLLRQQGLWLGNVKLASLGLKGPSETDALSHAQIGLPSARNTSELLTELFAVFDD